MTDHFSRASRERDMGNPDWRSYMPLRWHVSRWWSIWWPILVPCATVAVACVVALALGGWL